MNTKNKQSVKTQKTNEATKFVTRNLKAVKGSRAKETQSLTVDPHAMDVMFNAMPSQLQQALNKAELAPNHSINLKVLNDWWIAEYIDTGIFVQDVYIVLAAYVARFRKTYKGFKPEELATLFTIS